MGEVLKHLRELKEMYTIFIFFIGVVIASYTGYTDIISNIEENTRRVESTQITMLKSIVREFENEHHCVVSDAEWDEYILNYSTLFDLKQKHNLLSDKAQWNPIERSKIQCED